MDGFWQEGLAGWGFKNNYTAATLGEQHMLYISIQIKGIYFEDSGTAVTWDSHKCLENCQSFLSGSRYRSKNASKNVKLILRNRAWISLPRSQHSLALIWLSSALGTVFLWSLLIKHLLISVLEELEIYNNYYEWSLRVGLIKYSILWSAENSNSVLCFSFASTKFINVSGHYLSDHNNMHSWICIT